MFKKKGEEFFSIYLTLANNIQIAQGANLGQLIK